MCTLGKLTHVAHRNIAYKMLSSVDDVVVVVVVVVVVDVVVVVVVVFVVVQGLRFHIMCLLVRRVGAEVWSQ